MPILTQKMVTFADYMEQSLYGPDGYYASGQARSGREGDYFTAPDVGPVFGQLLSEIFRGWQHKLGFPAFQLVEAGAGEGHLAKSLSRDFAYLAIERSPFRRERLETLGFKALPALEGMAPDSVLGCLFANELLDAFPVHRVRMHGGKLQEAYVQGSDLVWDTPSTSKLVAYLDRINVELPEGYETEINLAMADWFQEASRVLKQGLILLIDYGRPAHAYYAPERDRGTLRVFRRHRVFDPFSENPPATPLCKRGERGDFDITADVDFTSAALDAQAAGLTPLAYMELGSFLIQAMSNEQRAMSGNSWLMAHRSSLQYLIHPDGMGSAFQILILGKNITLNEKDFPNNRLSRLCFK